MESQLETVQTQHTKKTPAGKDLRQRRGLENVILIAIVLVIIHTFISEIGTYFQWTVTARNALVLLGLLFDILFTVEFIARSISHWRRKSLVSYWVHNRGWVDFFASIPLLLFNSGPMAYLIITGRMTEGVAAIGVLNVLKVVKAIRVTRILRLIRIMKIFGKIKNAESKMAQHHTVVISTTAVSIVLFTLMMFTVFFGDGPFRQMDARQAYYSGLLQRLLTVESGAVTDRKSLVSRVLAGDGRVLKLEYEGKPLFSNVGDEAWRKYSPDDFAVIQNGSYELYYSLTDINREQALGNIRVFSIILALVVGFMFMYTRHFVQTISDIVYILLRGFRQKSYNLQVKIPEQYSDHEIFHLARFYNERFLPAKMKRVHQAKIEKKSDLSMQDLLHFKGSSAASRSSEHDPLPDSSDS